MSHCCAVMIQSPHTLLKGRVQACGQKDHLEGTKVAVFPSLSAPQESPDRQRSGLAATEEWRPGRRRATRLPTEERATQRACESSVWARATAASKKAWRTGAVYLHLHAARYGRWVLSKACHPPSPFGLRVLCISLLLFHGSAWWRTSRRVASQKPVRSCALCAKPWHGQFSPCLVAVWETLGPERLSNSLFTTRRADRPEVRDRRQFDFSGIYGTFSLTASEQFPRFPSWGRFARTQVRRARNQPRVDE